MAEFSVRVDGVPTAEYAQAFARGPFANFLGIQQVLLEMYAAWLSRCLGEVEAILPRTLLGMPIVSRLILDDRNMAWLPKIEATIEAPERTLIVVGAAHLPRE